MKICQVRRPQQLNGHPCIGSGQTQAGTVEAEGDNIKKVKQNPIPVIMKRLFLTVLGLALVAAPALRAQSLEGIGLTVEKVNVDKLKSAIAKSNAEIADAKKNTKAATWIKRGEAFVDADAKPVNGLFTGLDEATLKTTYGNAAIENIKLGDTEYVVYTYEHFKAYVKAGKLEFHTPVTVIDPAALDKAYEAFAKAYDLDKNSVKKVNAGMLNVQNKSMENGSAYYTLKEFKTAADNFRRAYKASAHPAVNNIDTTSLFYAGFLGTIAGDYKTALDDLNKAIELDYGAEGETYYYKFHCLYNLGDEQGALETLEYAITLYPNNDSILEGLLSLYSSGDKDPTSLIPKVLNAIEQNPTNAGLYLGLARVYDKLDQQDNAIEAAKKAASLTPGDFYASYFAGLFTVKKGDAMDSDLRNMTITSRAQYQQALAEVNEVYAQAVAPLEKALSLNPSELATVELLKNLTFRLRDDAAMSAKYDKYEALYKEMTGGE